MKRIMLILILAAFAAGCAKHELPSPVAPKEPKAMEMFGISIQDDYAWMRNFDDPRVMNLINQENSNTEQYFRHMEPLRKELYTEFLSRIKETDTSAPYRMGDYYYYSRTEQDMQYDIYCRMSDGNEQVMLDVNQIGKGHAYTGIGLLEVSPSQNILAFSVDTSGNEEYTVMFKDLATGQLLADRLNNVSSLEWSNDSRTVYYVEDNEIGMPYRVMRHTLGEQGDEELYTEKDDRYWLWVEKSLSGKYIFIGTASKITSEYRYMDADDRETEPVLMVKRSEGIEYYPNHSGNYFYILTNLNAENFRVVKTPVEKCGTENWKEVIAHSQASTIEGITLFSDFMAVFERTDGLRKIRIIDLETMKGRYVDMPEEAYSIWSASNKEFKTGTFRFGYSSFISLTTIYDYVISENRLNAVKVYNVKGGYDASLYETKRMFAEADDGTMIPISIVYKKGNAIENQPLLLTGYGAYGSSEDPYFSSIRLSLLNRGIVFAIAHIRGGGEMGRKWYDNGKLLNKKNTFTDFIACAEYLISEGYTSSSKLTISGGSAGGLLMGAVVNMRPDLFGNVIASVPFVDVINTMLDPTIPLTTQEYEEWGNPNEEKYFKYMYSYSPYDNVKDAVYPRMFIYGGLNDARVAYWEPLKWAAKLREHNIGNNTILLKMNTGAGHGGSSGRYDWYNEIAYEYAYILDYYGNIK